MTLPESNPGYRPPEGSADDTVDVEAVRLVAGYGKEFADRYEVAQEFVERLAAVTRERDGLAHDLDGVHLALAEANIERAAGIDEPLWSEQHRVRLLRERAEAAEAELAAARETIQRLNRRAQQAEAVADENVEACRRAGVSLGRGLANYAATRATEQLAAAQQREQQTAERVSALTGALEAVEDVTRAAITWAPPGPKADLLARLAEALPSASLPVPGAAREEEA